MSQASSTEIFEDEKLSYDSFMCGIYGKPVISGIIFAEGSNSPQNYCWMKNIFIAQCIIAIKQALMRHFMLWLHELNILQMFCFKARCSLCINFCCCPTSKADVPVNGLLVLKKSLSLKIIVKTFISSETHFCVIEKHLWVHDTPVGFLQTQRSQLESSVSCLRHLWQQLRAMVIWQYQCEYSCAVIYTFQM